MEDLLAVMSVFVPGNRSLIAGLSKVTLQRMKCDIVIVLYSCRDPS